MSETHSPTATRGARRSETPMTRYRADLERRDFQRDAAQEQAVAHLQRLYDELVATPPSRVVPPKRGGGLTSRVAGLFGRRERDASPEPALPAIHGLYFWGGWAAARPT